MWPWASKNLAIPTIDAISSSRKSLLLSQTKFSELWMAAPVLSTASFSKHLLCNSALPWLRRVHRLRREMRWHVRFSNTLTRHFLSTRNISQNFNLTALDAKCGCGDSKVHYVTCAGICWRHLLFCCNWFMMIYVAVPWVGTIDWFLAENLSLHFLRKTPQNGYVFSFELLLLVCFA